jgi:DNA-directed RNA polymerase subunit RPC12/RpoP
VSDIYRCPVCGKPFNMTDKLADFALAAHEKEHQTMKPERLLVQRNGLWVCTRCGEPFGSSKDMAKLGMSSHMKEHGIRPASSSAPDATKGGKERGSSGSGSTFAEGVSDFVGDVVEGLIEGVGKALGKILDP